MENQRFLTIVAQDPSVRRDGGILTARVAVPRENLAPGPRGARVHVVDYDAASKRLYLPREIPDASEPSAGDRLLDDPAFHAQNVYAVVMLVLAQFERALGRRVGWAFPSHQLKIAPHAFAGPNAFYSRSHQALLFGYLARPKIKTVFTCLAFDIIAHETAHAILDGLRSAYVEPSGPDQAAFHEGFADIVSLLAVLSLPEVIEATLDLDRRTRQWRLRESKLVHLAKELSLAIGASQIRRPASLKPSATLLDQTGFESPHRRGEVLAAAMLSAFLDIWERRTSMPEALLPAGRVAEEGGALARALLTLAIRALDYLPPTDVRFGDFVSALATVEAEHGWPESRFHPGAALAEAFARYGIAPASKRPGGAWPLVEQGMDYRGVHLESLQRDPEEFSAFLWANRTALGLMPKADTRVVSVRPAVRLAGDGAAVRETVAEYRQTLVLPASELGSLSAGIQKPAGMPESERVKLTGGGVVVLDEYGRARYHIANSLLDGERQSQRLQAIWDHRDEDPAGRRTSREME